jgi:hypothetical protein
VPIVQKQTVRQRVIQFFQKHINRAVELLYARQFALRCGDVIEFFLKRIHGHQQHGFDQQIFALIIVLHVAEADACLRATLRIDKPA